MFPPLPASALPVADAKSNSPLYAANPGWNLSVLPAACVQRVPNPSSELWSEISINADSKGSVLGVVLFG